MGVTSSTSHLAQREPPPPWVKVLCVLPEYTADKMGALSDGMSCMGANTVIRHRAGHFHSDAAKWGRGFTSGKHCFEIHFPEVHRGMEAMVGVGTESAPVFAKGKVQLVGFTRDSWGISLRSRRAFHRKEIVKKYPVTQVRLPDSFYMYLDMDSGRLQFGTDWEFYGTAHCDLPRNQPLYPMVSSIAQGAAISIIYRGMGEAVPYASGPQVAQGQHVQYTTTSTTPFQHSAVVMAPVAGTTIITSATAPPPPDGSHNYPPPPAYSSAASPESSQLQAKQ